MTDIKQHLIDKVLIPIEKAGFKAYFVGGCVRDKLMRKEPHDYDIAVSAQPADLHKIFSKFSNVSKNAEQFGVTMILIPSLVQGDDLEPSYMEVEIASFRKDVSKGRHPEVSLEATLEEDASRRDFTINAMYEDKDGNIVDPFGGQKDIEQKALRFVGDPKERLEEDPLRAFRFVRFLAKTGFTAAYDTEEIKRACEGLNFSEVSKERMLKEFKQIIAGKFFTYKSEAFHFAYAARVFEVVGLLDIFTEMDMVEQAWRWHAEGSVFLNPEGKEEWIWEQKDFRGYTPIVHGSVLAHTFLTFAEMHKIIFEGANVPELEMNLDEEQKFLLKLGALLHDIGKTHCQHQGVRTKTFMFDGKEILESDIPVVNEHPERGVEPAEKFCKALKMSNEETHFICSLIAHHMEAHELSAHKHFSDILKFVKHPHFKEIMMVALADERGAIKLEGFDERGCVAEIMKDERVVKAQEMEVPKPILTGDDLIKFGKKPGPLFRKMLEVAHSIQIDQGITDKHMLYKMVKNVELAKGE